MNNEKRVVILQIKQDGSNHLLTLDILSERHANKPYALTQKDGKLAVSTGFGEAVLTLSDDGNTLYLDNKNYHKIDESTKDKLVTLQDNCKALSEQFSSEYKGVKLFTDGFQQKQDAIVQTYVQKFNELEKDGICNSKPTGVEMKQKQS